MSKLKPTPQQTACRIFWSKVAAAKTLYDLNNNDIAAMLGISLRTVENRKKSLTHMTFSELVHWCKALHFKSQDIVDVLEVLL